MNAVFAVAACMALASADARVLLGQSNQAQCQQLSAQITQLNTQTTYVNNQAVACAAGGQVEPYNPDWAPWPTHAWPASQNNQCQQMSAQAAQIQQSNDAQIAQIQQQMNSMDC